MNAIVNIATLPRSVPMFTKGEPALFLSEATARRFAARMERGQRYTLAFVSAASHMRDKAQRGFTVTLDDKFTGMTVTVPETWVD